MSNTFICSVCGFEVVRGSLSCPECGACDDTGWGKDHDSGIDLPDDDFDYDVFVEREFDKPRQRSGKEKIAAAVAILLLLVWVLFYVIR